MGSKRKHKKKSKKSKTDKRYAPKGIVKKFKAFKKRTIKNAPKGIKGCIRIVMLRKKGCASRKKRKGWRRV
jgi:hypothetical protein